MGLPVPATVAGSSDTLSTQFWALLNECGLELLDKHDWQFFNKTHTIVTTPPTLTYALPTDFERYLGMTGWNHTSQIPLGGPVSPQDWASIQAQVIGNLMVQLQYRISQDQVEFYSLPDVAQTVKLGYIGRGWVSDATTPTTYKDNLEADADLIMYDPHLIVQMLKYRWREAKGFDSSMAKKDYMDALNAAMGKDTPPKDLRLDGRARNPFLGIGNVPESGYGS
jgi:hypothetical protein